MTSAPLQLMIGGRVPLAFDDVAELELLEYLGGGGFGSVWKTRDPITGRFYTLKVIQNVENKGLDIERVRNEAEVAISSEYIVSVIGLREWDEHTFLILFEYFAAQSLDIWLKRNQLNDDHKKAIFPQILYGVSDAHRSNIIHRDLKPANVLVSNDHVVKLIDFGISKFKNRNITKPGVTFGTPSYMAPELLALGSHCADAKSDIYALGQLFFELVTGNNLWIQKDWQRVRDLVAFLRQDPPPTEVMDLKLFHCDYYPQVEEILLRMVKVDPVQRFDSVDAIIEAIGLTGARWQPRLDTYDFPVLIVESGTNRNARTFLQVENGKAVVMGRADFAGDDESISRRHLEISRLGHRYWIRDLGSKNGIMIGGSRLQPQRTYELHHADRVKVGDVFLRFAFLQESAHREPLNDRTPDQGDRA